MLARRRLHRDEDTAPLTSRDMECLTSPPSAGKNPTLPQRPVVSISVLVPASNLSFSLWGSFLLVLETFQQRTVCWHSQHIGLIASHTKLYNLFKLSSSKTVENDKVTINIYLFPVLALDSNPRIIKLTVSIYLLPETLSDVLVFRQYEN